MTKKIIRIGTRGSALALYQARLVQQRIKENFFDVDTEVTVIKTKGDKILDTPLSQIGDKGLFTKELEDAMQRNEIDMSVHSLKDLPTVLPEGFILAGVLERIDQRDVLISNTNKKLCDLNADDVVATSSLRRKAQLLHYNPALKIIDIRGNVDTRLQKLHDGYCTAIVLAAAGVIRLQKQEYITEYLSPENMIPAVCQGIIGIETREEDAFMNNICATITHPASLILAHAERAFLNTLQGGCQVPIGCYAIITDNQFTITGFIASLDGTEMVKETLLGNVIDASTIAVNTATNLMHKGGKDILKRLIH